MKKVCFITNIPSPYRIDFYNELGKYVDLTVVFEARRVNGISFNWNDDNIRFNAIFLSEDEIQEKKINKLVDCYIKKNKYDYVFVTNYAYYTELYALLKIKFKKIPYILELDGALIRKENKLKYLIKKYLISGAMAYFSPSKSSDKVLMHYGVNKNKIVRYPFSSLKNIDIKEKVLSHNEKIIVRKKLKINDERMILCVGQFIPRKGNDVLINAATKIDKNIGIYFVGGEATDEYKDLVRKNNLTNIHFVGFQSNEILSMYYDAADVFVLPTREDVWGLVINEAMSHGLPVITTHNCVAGMELVKDNGIIVPVNDVEALAKSIMELFINSDVIVKMGQKSLQYIKEYTIEKMVASHIEYFKGYSGKK